MGRNRTTGGHNSKSHGGLQGLQWKIRVTFWTQLLKVSCGKMPIWKALPGLNYPGRLRRVAAGLMKRNQPVFDGVSNQIETALEAQLRVNAGTVCLNGFGADVQV